MTQPTPYNPAYSFTDFSSGSPSSQPPGTKLDAEFNAIANTLARTLANLSEIQRDDGNLANDSVGIDQLTDKALALIASGAFHVKGGWLTATNYVLGDIVSSGNIIYLCMVAHHSGILDTDAADGKFIAMFGTDDFGDVRSAVAVGTVSLLIGNRIYASRAALNADLAHNAGDYALVVGDATAANNDLYLKSGLINTGSWGSPLGLFVAASALANAARDEILNNAGFIAVAGDLTGANLIGILAASGLPGIAAYVNSAIAAAAAAAADRNAIATLLAFQPQRAGKAIDTSVTSSTALIDDPDLVVPLPANSRTNIRALVQYSAGTTGDLKYRLSGSVSAASFFADRRVFAPGASAFTAPVFDTAYSASDIVVDGATGDGVLEMNIAIHNGAVAGVFNFKWAQNTSNGTPTIVKADSYFDYWRQPTSAPFAFASTAIAKLGGFNGPTSSGGHNVITAVAPTAIGHSYIETMATGTACDAQLFSGSYALEVDGVATTFTAPAGWSYVNLFTGLTDAPHRVRLTGIAYDSDIALRVSGTGPDLTRPADVPAFYPLTLAPNDGYVGRDGPMQVGTFNSYPTTESVWTVGNGFGFHFNATTTSVRIWFYDGASVSTIVLKQDGAVISTTVPPGTGGNYQVITLATGLTGAHDYEVCFISSQKAAYCYAVLVDTLTATSHPAKALDAYYGDSIVQMAASPTLADARVGDSYILANSLGRAAVRVGVGGTGVSVDASGNLAVKYGRANTAGITGLPQAPTRVFVCYGTNDEYFGVSTATFQADYQTMLAAIRTGLPSAKIYARGILPHTRAPAGSPGLTPSQVATLTATYNAAMQAAVTALADANIVYVSTLGWLDTTGGSGDFLDTVHPTAQGYAKIAAAQALVL